MIHQEPTGAFKAGFLLALGGSLGLIGLVLMAGRSIFHQAAALEAPRTLGTVLDWGPRAFLGAGGTLAATAAVVIWVGWSQKKS